MKRIAIVLGLLILVLIGLFLVKVIEEEKAKEGGQILLKEKQLIENWILKNNLNQYGDPKDTVYIGGTPLFDERTGQTIDKYEYIIKNHPDRPWEK